MADPRGVFPRNGSEEEKGSQRRQDNPKSWLVLIGKTDLSIQIKGTFNQKHSRTSCNISTLCSPCIYLSKIHAVYQTTTYFKDNGLAR